MRSSNVALEVRNANGESETGRPHLATEERKRRTFTPSSAAFSQRMHGVCALGDYADESIRDCPKSGRNILERACHGSAIVGIGLAR